MRIVQGSWPLALAVAGLACGSTAGSPDGGGDAGPGCGSSCPQPCTTLVECDGGLGVAVCAQGFCQSAGGPPLFGLARVELPSSFAGDQAASLVVRVLAPVLPTPGPALDCPTVLGRIDAGTLDVDDPLKVNPLLAAYSVSPRLLSGQSITNCPVDSIPSGGMPLLLIEGFLDGSPDGGTDAIGCTSYSAIAAADGGPPTVGLVLSPW